MVGANEGEACCPALRVHAEHKAIDKDVVLSFTRQGYLCAFVVYHRKDKAKLESALCNP